MGNWMIVAMYATFIVGGALVLFCMWPILAVLGAIVYGALSGI